MILNETIQVPDYTDNGVGLAKCEEYGIDGPNTFDPSQKIH